MKGKMHNNQNIVFILTYILMEFHQTVLDTCYFKLREREKNWEIYAYLWIKMFKKFTLSVSKLSEILFRHRISHYHLRWRTLDDLKIVLLRTKFNEAYHVMRTLPCVYLVGITTNNWLGAQCVALSMLLWNTYCIILQRYNRGRLQTTLHKVREHKQMHEQSEF